MPQRSEGDKSPFPQETSLRRLADDSLTPNPSPKGRERRQRNVMYHILNYLAGYVLL